MSNIFVCLTVCLLTVVASANAGCASGWLQQNNACYKFYKGPVTWAEAELSCQKHVKGGHLVSVKDRMEGYTVDMVSNGAEAWIGLYALYGSHGQWFWSDGTSPGYTAWRRGQPDHANDEYGALVSCADGNHARLVWDDKESWRRTNYICKYKL